jgi:hypothetical protein
MEEPACFGSKKCAGSIPAYYTGKEMFAALNPYQKIKAVFDAVV